MKFIDTHAHLYAPEFNDDRQEVMERAMEAGVTKILLPDVEAESRPAMLQMAQQYPNCYPMIGLHPTCVNDNPSWRDELRAVEDALRQDASRFCAVGEFGLDLYWSRAFHVEQCEAFERQVELALEFNLPVDIHTRDAWDECLSLLEGFRGRGVRGAVHAYSGSVEHYHRLLEIGDFVFGIGGVVTFKKSKLAPVVAHMSLEHIVLETDAPYLTPTPHRGTRNESSYIPFIADTIAQLHAVSLEDVARQTTTNAERIFGI